MQQALFLLGSTPSKQHLAHRKQLAKQSHFLEQAWCLLGSKPTHIQLLQRKAESAQVEHQSVKHKLVSTAIELLFVSSGWFNQAKERCSFKGHIAQIQKSKLAYQTLPYLTSGGRSSMEGLIWFRIESGIWPGRISDLPPNGYCAFTRFHFFQLCSWTWMRASFHPLPVNVLLSLFWLYGLGNSGRSSFQTEVKRWS